MATAASESGFVDNWQGSRTVIECNLYMLTTQDGWDVSFLVGPTEEKVRAHRYVLMSRSCVFHAMLCGPLAEKDAIKIPDVSEEDFAEFLKFLYTDRCSISAKNTTVLLYLSKKYGVERLQCLCLSFLEKNLSVENACVILGQAHLFDETNLLRKALKIIMKNGEIIFKTSDFRELSKDCLDMILESPDLDLEPGEVFTAVLSWAEAECSRQGREWSAQNKRAVLGESIYLIDFVKPVVPENIMLESEIVKLISFLSSPDTDVKPFKVGSCKSRTFELPLYKNSHKPDTNEETHVENYHVSDRFIVKSNLDLYIQSIVLSPIEDGTYTVSIEYQSGDFNTIKCHSELSSSSLECNILIRANTECKIVVIHESGDCPLELMTGLREEFELGNHKVSIERQQCDGYRTKGMVKTLIGKKIP